MSTAQPLTTRVCMCAVSSLCPVTFSSPATKGVFRAYLYLHYYYKCSPDSDSEISLNITASVNI